MAASRLCIALALASCAHAHFDEGTPGPAEGRDGMPERERIEAYKANGHQWPTLKAFASWPPAPAGEESEAYQRSRDAMEARIRGLDDSGLKWNEWMALVQSRLMPAFTPTGFKLAQLPEDLWRDLKESYHRGLREHPDRRETSMTGIQDPDLKPIFVRQHRLNQRVMEEMKPRMEEWAGVPLTMGQAYGVRIYQNGSTLVNHVDRSETHIISFIAHIDSDLDEPWPIEIEDHDGNVHAVSLQPGQVLYYESSKQYHARVTPMRGRHYGSVFVHYYPSDRWTWSKTDIITAVPLDWHEPVSRLAPARRAALEAAGGRPIDAFYEEYWTSHGWSMDAAPPFPINTGQPVQNVCELPRMNCARTSQQQRADGGSGEEL